MEFLSSGPEDLSLTISLEEELWKYKQSLNEVPR